mmetsp:Transcript_36369/g.104540  ORF Transcript_36369/g.104540 Transcript_36369/m.104540 type:complete len:651 (+) Transcript_36369:99-2051(+)
MKRRRPGMGPRNVASVSLLLAAFLCTPCSAAASAGAARLRRGTRARAGVRASAAEEGEGHVGHHKDLYGVDLHFDIQEMRTSEGLTMQFDGKHNRLRLELGVTPIEGIAWGNFNDRIDTTGWSELFVETSKGAVSNDVRVYSAGYVEGVLTCVRLSEFNANARMLLEKKADQEALTSVRKHLRAQVHYLKSMIGLDGMRIAEEPSDPYWKQVRYVFFQLWGLNDGYNKVARHFQVRELDMEDLILLNVGGELQQLLEAFSPDAVVDRAKSRPASFLQMAARAGAAGRGREAGAEAEDPLDDRHWERRVQTAGKCSALVRLANSNSDLLIGHTTWDDYSKMTRIYKYYTFHLTNADNVATKIGFSSYPGTVSSTDDFYMMDSGLTVMETSLIILDPHAWNSVGAKPTIPTFMHLMATNRMARTASDWARRLMSGATGTYTSQWMVVDYNQFKPQVPLENNTFWVVEMVPGVAHAQDMTTELKEKGFFASYNRPYFPATRLASGHQKAEASHGDLYSFDKNPRAKRFAAEAAEVNAAGGMRVLMSQNLYPHSSSAGHEISARMDLLQLDATPNGGIDVKVTNCCLQKLLSVQAISAPSHQTLPPFRWLQAATGAEVWPGYPHVGLPDVWSFDFVQISPVDQGPIQEGLANAC